MPRKMRLPLNLSYDVGRKFLRKKAADGYENNTLEEYIQFLVKDTNLEPSPNEVTVMAYQELWMKNFADNIPYIRFGDNVEVKMNGEFIKNDLADLAEPNFPLNGKPKSSAIVVGAGPSIDMNNHLDMLKSAIDKGYNGKICCTDKMLRSCLSKGIVPDITTSVDGNDVLATFYDAPIVKEYGSKINVALNATVSNKVYLACQKSGCKVHWFYAQHDDWRKMYSFTRLEGLMTLSPYRDKVLQSISCGGNTGFVAWVMATSLFKRSPVALIGIDFGYPEGTNLETTTYFSSIEYNTNQGRERALGVMMLYSDYYHPVWKKWAKTDRVFKGYKKTFIEAQKNIQFYGEWFEKAGGTINCTEGGTLYGPGITCIPFREFFKKYENIEV